MNYLLLELKQKKEWTEFLNKLPVDQQDIYFTPEYYYLYENNGDGKAMCFVFEKDGQIALYPFLLNSVNKLGYELDGDYYDIQGAYGYNGIISSSFEEDFIKSFHEAFIYFCNSKNIIAEFTRFHPLINNHQYSKGFLDVIYNRKTVYIDLTDDYDQIFNNYSSSGKRALRKAKNSNLTTIICQNEFPYKKDFIQLYKENMVRVNSKDYLFFNDIYFDNIFNNLPIIQFIVLLDELPIASSIFLYHGIYLHYHLGGSKGEHLSLRPNNLLFDSVLRFGKERGFKKLLLGGGNSSLEDDSLLRFKQNFSRTTSDFYIGKKIHNQEVYQQVIKKWMDKNSANSEKSDNVLLKHRTL